VRVVRTSTAEVKRRHGERYVVDLPLAGALRARLSRLFA
jgi:hypothetical protein